MRLVARRSDGGKILRARSHHLLSWLAFFFFIAGALPAHGRAADQCVERYWDQLLASAATSSPPSARGSLERLLREALLDELLSDVDRELLVAAYQAGDWRPFFVTAEFELTSAAVGLLNRLRELESDAIDARPYRLPQLEEKAGELKQLRKGPDQTGKRALRELLDNLAARTAGQQQPSPCQQLVNIVAVIETEGASPEPDIRKPAAAVQGALDRWIQDLHQQAATTDVHLAAALLRFARDMNRFHPEQLTSALHGRLAMAELIKSLQPASVHYETLRRVYQNYWQMARRATQKRLADSETLRPGTQGAAVRALQERLQEEGYYKGESRGYFDSATVEALKHFQMQHSLGADGVLGAKTVECLNIPYDKKAWMIAQSLAGLRNSETRHYDRYVRINIPQFTLEYYRDSRLQATYRVIVGKASGKKIKVMGRWMGENHTPTLAASIQQVIFNPRWYVSDRIMRELGEEAAGDPGYFVRMGYVKMASYYPWGAPRLYQRPGPHNPLGRVKFEFPNPYAVYLHDTNKKHLFSRARRDFSHGCMRLENALDFARALLVDDQNPALQKMDQYLSDTQQRFVELRQPVPIVVEYLMAASDAHGRVVFLGDPYGWYENSGEQALARK